MVKSPLSPQDLADILWLGCQERARYGPQSQQEGNFRELVGLMREHLKTLSRIGGARPRVSTHAAQTLYALETLAEVGGVTIPKPEDAVKQKEEGTVDLVKRLLSDPKTQHLVSVPGGNRK